MSNNVEKTALLFFETGRMIRKKLGMEKFPLTFIQAETLRFVADRKEPTMRDIAAYLEIRAPSATSLISQLTRRGLLVRIRNAQDRRQVRVRLTNEAHRTLARMQRAKSRALTELMRGLSAKDHADLSRTLEKMLKNK